MVDRSLLLLVFNNLSTFRGKWFLMFHLFEVHLYIFDFLIE